MPTNEWTKPTLIELASAPDSEGGNFFNPVEKTTDFAFSPSGVGNPPN